MELGEDWRIRSDGDVREAAARAYVMCFPLFLTDAVRRAHPIALSNFHLLGADAENLAPGLVDDDPRVILSSAWIDLSSGPMVVRLPHMHGRHFSLTVFDTGGQHLVSVGSRTGEDDGLDLVLVGPLWAGEVRRGVRAKRSTSESCWAVSRIWAHSMLDRSDAIAVARRQGLASLRQEVSLMEAANSVLEPFPAGCLRQITDITPEVFFQRLGTILERAPVAFHGAERKMLVRLGNWIGLPSSPRWTPEFVDELARGFADGLLAIQSAVPDVYAEQGPGWRTVAAPAEPDRITPLARAATVYESLGAPPREVLLSLVCTHDRTGRVLTGGNAYRIRMSEGTIPPVNDFWRLYARPAAGPQYRTGIGSRNDLLLNADGSLDLTIQHPLPEAAGISNWLPAPEGELALVMRLHSPRPAALKGAWRMPAVERLDPGSGHGRRRRRRVPPVRRPLTHELRTTAPAERNEP